MHKAVEQAGKQAQSWIVGGRVADMAEALRWVEQELNPPWPPERVYPCHRMAGPITVDGRLDEAAWAALPEASGVRIPTPEGHLAVVRQTHFRAGWDDANLYLAVRCEEPDVTQAQASAGNPGMGSFGQNSIEFLAAPALAATTTYYRVAVTAGGTREGPDRFVGGLYNRQIMNVADAASAAGIGPGEWTIEARIPLTTFGATPTNGTDWRVNVCRNVRLPGGAQGEDFSTWSPLRQLNWHLCRFYNRLVFHAATLTAAEAAQATARLDAGASARRAALLERHTRVAAIRTAGAAAGDLAKAKGFGVRASSQPMSYGQWHTTWTEWGWPTTQTNNALVVTWAANPPAWFTVETSADGRTWELLEEVRDNEQMTVGFRFAPRPAQALRIAQYTPLGRDQTQMPVKTLEAYNLPVSP